MMHRASAFRRTFAATRSLSTSSTIKIPHKILSHRAPGTYDLIDWTKKPLSAAESDAQAESSNTKDKMMPRPLKVQLFVDGTWLYYSLVLGRNGSRMCPMTMKLGENWQRSHSIDWPRLPQIVGEAVQKQLNHMYVYMCVLCILCVCVFCVYRSSSTCQQDSSLDNYKLKVILISPTL